MHLTTGFIKQFLVTATVGWVKELQAILQSMHFKVTRVTIKVNLVIIFYFFTIMNCQVSQLNTCGIETFKFTSCSATLTVSGTFCNTILVPLVIHLRFVCSSPRISPSQIKMTSACLTPNLPQIIDFKEDEGWSCKYNHRYNHSKLFSAYYNSTTTVIPWFGDSAEFVHSQVTCLASWWRQEWTDVWINTPYHHHRVLRCF